MRRVRMMLVAIMALALHAGPVLAAEAVIVSSKVKWNCEGDIEVQVNDDNGDLRVISKSASVDQTLPLRYCHSSHCDWGLSSAAAECGEIQCFEIVAGPDDQRLMITLAGLAKTCQAKKP